MPLDSMGTGRASPAPGSRKATNRVRQILGGRVMAIGVLFAVAALLLKSSPLFEPSPERTYDECRTLLARVKDLSERKASAEEWAALERDATQRLTPMVSDLEKRGKQAQPLIGGSTDFNVNYYLRRPLIQVGKYDLPKLIQQVRTGEPSAVQIKNIEEQLDQVRQRLDAIKLGTRAETAPQAQ